MAVRILPVIPKFTPIYCPGAPSEGVYDRRTLEYHRGDH